jgi:uncharacterized protein (DUF2147 family)
MKKTNGVAFPEKVRGNSAAVLASLLMIPMLCLLFDWQVRAEDGKANGQKQAHADYARIAGSWLRPDGGYVLELKDVGPKGRLKARYFNPNPINVAKAEWRRTGDRLQVFVELRDVNYPGSTYTLVYSPEKDRLEGNYYQAVQGQTYAIGFIRMK